MDGEPRVWRASVRPCCILRVLSSNSAAFSSSLVFWCKATCVSSCLLKSISWICRFKKNNVVFFCMYIWRQFSSENNFDMMFTSWFLLHRWRCSTSCSSLFWSWEICSSCFSICPLRRWRGSASARSRVAWSTKRKTFPASATWSLLKKVKLSLRLLVWPGDWSAVDYGSAVGSQMSLSPGSAWTPPSSACLSPYAASQPDPEWWDEINYEVDRFTSEKGPCKSLHKSIIVRCEENDMQFSQKTKNWEMHKYSPLLSLILLNKIQCDQ